MWLKVKSLTYQNRHFQIYSVFKPHYTFLFQAQLATLRYRLFNALPNTQGMQQPQRPFNVVNIMAEGSAQPSAQQQPTANNVAAAAPATRQRSGSGYYQVCVLVCGI